MISHLMAFIFYTMAMIGVLFVAFIVYKKTMFNPNNANKGLIKVLDNYPIAPKKSLMVVQIQNERFLIASGAEHTTFLAKLGEKQSVAQAITKAKEEYVDEQNQNVGVAINPPREINISPREINISQNAMNIQPIQQAVVQHDEVQQARLAKLQRQFNALYNQDTQEIQSIAPVSKSKRVLKKILQELNEDNKKMNGGY